jgi:hypothetical protein
VAFWWEGVGVEDEKRVFGAGLAEGEFEG